MKTKSGKQNEAKKIIATNRRARAKFEILETKEAGIVLTGPEVKSLRKGKINLQEGFVRMEGESEAYLWNAHISPYEQASTHVEQNPTRTRKLLLKKSEIRKWAPQSSAKGFGIVPLEIYFNDRGRVKVIIGLGRGKNVGDKRETIKKREVDRQMRRTFGDKAR